MVYFVYAIYIMQFRELMASKIGKIAISILLGVGLASMFRKTCSDSECYEFKGPKQEEIKNSTYRFGDKCYSFAPQAVSCDSTKVEVKFA